MNTRMDSLVPMHGCTVQTDTRRGMKHDTKTQNLESMQTEMPEMTDKQKEALERLRNRWAKILNVESSIGSDDAIMVNVQGETGITLWLGIETDGYTHE